MPTIYDKARDYGRFVHAGRNVLPELALDVARAAAAGELDVDDAALIYETYLKQARHVTKVNLGEPANRVQVSKLRQIIKLAAEHRRKAVDLIVRVQKVHASLERKDWRVPSLYSCLVSVARVQLSRPKLLTDGEIIKLCKKR